MINCDSVNNTLHQGRDYVSRYHLHTHTHTLHTHTYIHIRTMYIHMCYYLSINASKYKFYDKIWKINNRPHKSNSNKCIHECTQTKSKR